MSAGWVSPFPDPDHLLLLRASLEDAEGALPAFAEWSKTADLGDEVDEATFRLLPQAYHNLSRLGCTDGRMGLLKGVYRHSWAATQLRLERAARVISVIADAGIPVMASKGLALTQGYYASPALRPMADLDLYVPRKQAMAAVSALHATGWIPDANWHRSPAFVMLRFPAVTLRDAKGNEVDLQWDVPSESQSRRITERVWARAEPFTILGRQLYRPCATHLLLHVVVHGMRYNVFSPVRWINDAAMILRRSDKPVDWDELYEFAEQARLSHRLTLGLRYLRDTMHLNLVLPPEMPSPTVVERLENRYFLRDHTGRSEQAVRRSLEVSYLARFLTGDRRRQIPRLVLRRVSSLWRGLTVSG